MELFTERLRTVPYDESLENAHLHDAVKRGVLYEKGWDEMNDMLTKRKRNRLKNYDYSQNGYYFITVCTHNRKNLFGIIDNEEIKLNEFGKIVDFTWNDLKNHNNIELHQYAIMPDHLHGIIEIYDQYCRRERSATVPNSANYHPGIPEIVRQFKTFSSKRINELLKQNGYEPFPMGGLWQKSYYEHIIRDEKDYLEKAEYILNNPLKLSLSKIDQTDADHL